MKNPLIIIAANHQHARKWAHEHRVHVKDYLYIYAPFQLHGIDVNQSHVIFVPGFWTHPYSNEICDIVNNAREGKKV